MLVQNFLEKIEKNYQNAVEIIKRKNHDYASDADPFKNFRAAENLGITVEMGILVRMSDKLGRIANLVNGKQARVADESLQDTLIDLANYANILAVFLEHEKEKIRRTTLPPLFKYEPGIERLHPDDPLRPTGRTFGSKGGVSGGGVLPIKMKIRKIRKGKK